MWNYPRGKFVDPFVLPIVAQTGPLHRSHVRLTGPSFGMHGHALVIRTLEAGTVPRQQCQQVAQCSEAVIALIEITMRRANDAEACEQPAMIATF